MIEWTITLLLKIPLLAHREDEKGNKWGFFSASRKGRYKCFFKAGLIPKETSSSKRVGL